jgi:hypothetical protein
MKHATGTFLGRALIIGATLILLVGCSTPVDVDESHPWLPQEFGYHWEYRLFTPNDNYGFVWQVSGVEEINGHNCYINDLSNDTYYMGGLVAVEPVGEEQLNFWRFELLTWDLVRQVVQSRVIELEDPVSFHIQAPGEPPITDRGSGTFYIDDNAMGSGNLIEVTSETLADGVELETDLGLFDELRQVRFVITVTDEDGPDTETVTAYFRRDLGMVHAEGLDYFDDILLLGYQTPED